MNLSKQTTNELQNKIQSLSSEQTNDSNNNSIDKSVKIMPTVGSGSSCDDTSSSSAPDEFECGLDCEDECDINGHKLSAPEVERESSREELRKQFVDVYQLVATNGSATDDHQCWSSPLSSCSMSESSICCSPVSRMSSPSPTLTPSYYSPHSPSTLTSIRDAVSHLTRLDDFNVVKLSQGFFSQVFKVTHHSTRKVMVLKMNKQAGNRGGLHPLLEYINGGTLERLIRQYYKIDTYFDENKKLITRRQQYNQQNYNQNNNTISQHNNNANNNLNNCQKYIYCPQIYRLNDTDQTFIKLAEDVARGMDYLHSLHYLHRDLTSKNVLIRKLPPIIDDTDEFDAEPYLVAVIGDFGFSTSEPTKDQKLPTVGSPYWLAPECIKGQWYNHKCDIFSYGVICCELNWRIPADPDYLCRDDNFLINFDKLPALPNDSLLARIARLTCQKNPSLRPEFSEISELFESELMNDKSNNGLNRKMRSILRRDLSLSSNSSLDSSHLILNGSGDIFDQHLIRRRNSQIEKKYFNDSHR